MPRGDGTGPMGKGPSGGGRGQGGGAGGGGAGGGGRGRMGGTAAGPGGECVCPKCGLRVPHGRGTPCAGMFCPDCGTALKRAG